MKSSMESMNEAMMAGGEPASMSGSFIFVQVLSFVLPWLYSAFTESSVWQATLGKKALGIQVTDNDGDQISFWRATGRHWSKIISGIILCIGFIMVAFTKRKQGLHDMIAGTLVVKKS
ncbi:MAG: RDD family protein [Candidatus Electrothrix sp. AX2]|nr:RDD family protein [Candidatus Electrothrix gigas]